MTRYEQIMNISIEEMAKKNIGVIDKKYVIYDWSLFKCSDNFTTSDYNEAIQHEVEWLKGECDEEC